MNMNNGVSAVDKDALVNSNWFANDVLFYQLPKPLQDYLRYDCPFNIAIESVHRDLQKYGLELLLTAYKEKIRLLTVKAYGETYPL